MNKKRFSINNEFFSALIISPVLAIMIFSGIYQLMTQSNSAIKTGFPLLMGVLTLVSIAISLLIAFVLRKNIVPIIYALLFGLGFVCYLIMYMQGTTDIVDDSFFEMIMTILVFPLWSYMSVASAISDNTVAPFLSISAVITVVCVILAVIITIIRNRENEIARQQKQEAENRQSNNRRRKIR